MSSVPAVGIDLIEIDRLERALERRPRLASRLFTAAERAYAERQARPGQHLAARFCAKEAASKALGMALLRPLEIEVEARADGSPALRLTGATAELAAARGIELGCSLTHSKLTAAAIVVGGAL